MNEKNEVQQTEQQIQIEHPGGTIKRKYMRPIRLTQAELARTLKINPALLHQILGGKIRLSAKYALMFADVFQTSAEYWMSLSSKYEISVAMRSHVDLDAIETIISREKYARLS